MKTKILFLAMLAFILTGCTLSGTPETGEFGGGIYKTTDNGVLWSQKVLIPTTKGAPGNIATLNGIVLAMDPSDNDALYYGTLEHGLFYTYNGGNSWRSAYTLGERPIGGVTVDPNDKCNIYVVSISKIYKSTDCSRTWEVIYSDNELSLLIYSVVVDHYDSNIVYIGNSRGDIIKSYDAGESWQTMNNFKDDVREIIISPQDSRTIFVRTGKKGLFKSADGGAEWESLEKIMKEFPSSKKARDMYVSSSTPGLVILATDYGMLKSVNNGDDWTQIKLITPEREAKINSLTVSELDISKIYYVTNTTFYSTKDGGENWISQRLPTMRKGANLLADPETDGLIYMAPFFPKE